MEIGVGLKILREDLDTLDEDQHVRVDREDAGSCLLRRVFPVVLLLRVVPDRRAVLLIRLAVRLIFQIVRDDGVVVLIALRHPLESLQPVFFRHLLGVPKVHVVTGRIGLRAVDVRHDLDAVGLRQLQEIIEDLKAVHRVERLVVCVVVVGGRILAFRPLVDQLRGDRHADQVEAVIGDGLHRGLQL